MDFEYTIDERPVRAEPKPRIPRAVKPRILGYCFVCPNCEKAFLHKRAVKTYCSLQCSGEAEVVRYARRKYREYADGELPQDIDYAIRVQVALALGGGYDKAARRLGPEQRAAVIAADDERCRECGDPGEEIDHIDGPSNDPSNLQLLCHFCHMMKTRESFIPIDDPETKERLENLLLRMRSDRPLQACDANDWPSCWRAWMTDHRTEIH